MKDLLILELCDFLQVTVRDGENPLVDLWARLINPRKPLLSPAAREEGCAPSLPSASRKLPEKEETPQGAPSEGLAGQGGQAGDPKRGWREKCPRGEELFPLPRAP